MKSTLYILIDEVVSCSQICEVAVDIKFLIHLSLFIIYQIRYFSVVSPGDTVHVIGEFDSQGKCDVNREKNFFIVHPDILVSGTRVLLFTHSFLISILSFNLCACVKFVI